MWSQPNEDGIEILNSTGITINNPILSGFQGQAVMVNLSTAVTISNFTFADNVQNPTVTNPDEVALIRSNVTLKGGTITNNLGFAQRAVLMTGVGDGNYDLDGIVVNGSILSSTIFEATLGSGGIHRVNIVNNDIRSTWVSGVQILLARADTINVSGNSLHGGAPTTWLSSTDSSSNTCISNNVVDGGNILLHGVTFGLDTWGCFTSSAQITQVEAQHISNSGILLNSGDAHFGTTVEVDGAVTMSSTVQATGGIFTTGTTGGSEGAGTINVNGYYVGGAAGLSVTKTVRAAGGGSDCTLIFTAGLLTGGSC